MNLYRCFATLNKANLIHNIHVIKNLAPKAKIVAMLKANAYGHGIRSVFKNLSQEIEIFGVALVAEGLIIKQIDSTKRIVLMQGVLSFEDFKLALHNNLEIAIHNSQHLIWLEQFLLENNLSKSNHQFWFKINTGMNRLGFAHKIFKLQDRPLMIDNNERNEPHDIFTRKENDGESESESEEYYRKLLKLTTKNPIIFSHFACADNKESSLNVAQIYNFNNFIQNKTGEFSLCNSAGIINFPQYHLDYIRPGLMLYGISPISQFSAKDLDLKPVLKLESILLAKQHVKCGESLGYGQKFIANKDLTIGIVGFGYGDGYKFGINQGLIMLRGKLCQVLGSISMDLTAIDVSNVECSPGDIVTLIGEEISAEYCAKTLNTHPWDIVASIQNRVKFQWI